MALKIVYNVFTNNFDYVNTDSTDTGGFAWYYIPTGTTVTIDINREMITTSPQTIDGTLIVNGRNTVL